MFDCVLPTRVGRNGSAFTATGMMQIKAGRYKDDFRPIEEGCACYACTHFTRAYIRHLVNVGEILGLRLVTLHNLHFYLQMMRDIRRHIEAGTFADFRAGFHERYVPPASGRHPHGDGFGSSQSTITGSNVCAVKKLPAALWWPLYHRLTNASTLSLVFACASRKASRMSTTG